MDAYLDAADIRDDKGTPLFRTAYKKTGTLTERRLAQPDAWDDSRSPLGSPFGDEARGGEQTPIASGTNPKRPIKS